jgi:hypothetical protein
LAEWGSGSESEKLVAIATTARAILAESSLTTETR